MTEPPQTNAKLENTNPLPSIVSLTFISVFISHKTYKAHTHKPTYKHKLQDFLKESQVILYLFYPASLSVCEISLFSLSIRFENRNPLIPHSDPILLIILILFCQPSTQDVKRDIIITEETLILFCILIYFLIQETLDKRILLVHIIFFLQLPFLKLTIFMADAQRRTQPRNS